MIQTRKYLKSKPVCKVTFKLSPAEVAKAKTVAIAGEFNNWNTNTDIFKSLKDGSFTITKNLESGKTYAFRYVIDGKSWLNDADADGYSPSGVCEEENSLIAI